MLEQYSMYQIKHRDKVFWPEEGYTKGDLADYYGSISKYILPYLKDRPENLNRHPDGIKGMNFFQKNVPNHPKWVKDKVITAESTGRVVDYIVCNDLDTLMYMVNLGCIEINPWSSRVNNLDRPDYMIIDLDPGGATFDDVIATALLMKQVLDSVKTKSYVKTSGGSGLHIFVPMNAKYDYEQVRNFAEVVVNLAHDKRPDLVTLLRGHKKGRKKVYLDYLQNGRGQTVVSAYSVRPKPGATVSAPLKWSEVRKGLSPSAFTIHTVPKRLAKVGDLWKPVLGGGVDIKKALKYV